MMSLKITYNVIDETEMKALGSSSSAGESEIV